MNTPNDSRKILIEIAGVVITLILMAIAVHVLSFIDWR